MALATREHATALAHLHVQAHGVVGHHLVQARHLQHRGQQARVGVRAPQQDVVAQRAREQARLLRHEAHVGAVIGRVHLSQVQAIDLDHAVGRLVQPRQQAQHRRLATAHLAQDGHALARQDVDVQILEHRLRVVVRALGVSERHLAQSELPAQLGHGQVRPIGHALRRQAHDAVEHAQGRARALVARRQADDAAQRRHRTPGEHHRADQRATGDDAVVHQVHAPHQHHHRDELLRHRRGVVDPTRKRPGPHARLRRGGVGLFVAAQEVPGGTCGADVFDAFDGLDHHALHVRVLLDVGVQQLGQHALDQPRQPQQHRHRDHQHPAQGARGDEGHGDEQEHERQVGQRRQRGRGAEVAHRLDLRELVREAARRIGSVLQPQAQRLLEQDVAQHQVGLLAGQVEQVAAQLARQQIEDQGHEHARRQRPQRHQRLVRDHAVEHHRREQTGDQHQHVGQQRRDHRRAVVRHEALERVPQPVAIGLGELAVAVHRLAGRGRGHQRKTRVLDQQVGRGRFHGDALHGHHHLVALLPGRCGIRLDAAHQDADLATAQQQHHREQQPQDLVRLALDDGGLEPRVAHHAHGVGRHQRRGETGFAQQRSRRALAPMVTAQPQQRVQQRVFRARVRRRARRGLGVARRHRGVGRQLGGGGAVGLRQGRLRRVTSSLRGLQASPRVPATRASSWVSRSRTRPGVSNSGVWKRCSAR